MILIGTFDWKSTLHSGQFHCPNCANHQVYRRRSSRTFLTLYFIPVVPISAIVEFVECMHCKSSFGLEILALSEGKAAGNLPEPTFSEDLMTGMAAVMCDDGHVDEREIDAALKAYFRFAGETASREVLGKYCGYVQQMRLSSLSFVTLGKSRWSDSDRVHILQALFLVASATGEITARRNKTLLACMELFDLSQAEYEDIINAAIEAYA